MPSPCSASFIQVTWQLILLEEHHMGQAGQDTHVPRALWDREVWVSLRHPHGAKGFGFVAGKTK